MSDCQHENTQHDERIDDTWCSDCCEWIDNPPKETELKYYKCSILQRLGDYEDNTNGLASFGASADLEKEGYRMAMEWRGSEPDDFDESMGAYWFDGQGVVFSADFVEIDKATFDVLKEHVNAL